MLSFEVRQAWRGLWRSPGWFAAVSALLALGTGITVAAFALVDAVLLRPLPYHQPDRLVALFNIERNGSERRNPTAPANYLDWRAAGEAFRGMEAARYWSPTLSGAAQPERVEALLVTPGLFALLGVPAALGRTFGPDDIGQGNDAVVVLSHALWQARYGGVRDIVGRTIELDEQPYTVAGVMPATFSFPPFWATGAQLWAPLTFSPAEQADRGASYLRVFARLQDGATLERARANMDAVAARLARAYPATNEDVGINVEPMRAPAIASSRAAVLVIAGAILLLFVTTWGNVALMTLARFHAREHETAVRIALGGVRGRLVLQAVAEAALLALTGGVLGLLLGTWLVEAFRLLLPSLEPGHTRILVNGRALAFGAAVAGLSATTAALVPMHGIRSDIFMTLRTRRGERPGRRRLRAALVMGEVATATALALGSAWLAHSFVRLSAVDPGFRTTDVLTATLGFAPERYADEARQQALLRDISAHLAASPAVEQVGLVNHLPIGGDLWRTTFVVDGRTDAGDAPTASFRVADAGFFATLGIPLVAGRTFGPDDDADAEGVALVNQTLVRTVFGAADPVGARIRFGGPSQPALRVIGVVGDTHQSALADETIPEIFLPYTQNPTPWFRSATVVVRGRDPATLRTAIRAAVDASDAALPLSDVRTMGAVLRSDLRAERVNLTLVAAFAAGALLLAVFGLFAVVSQVSRERAHELAVRVALGARPVDVLAQIVGHGARLAAIGAALGLVVAFSLARFLESMLFGVSANDPAMLLLVLGVLAGATLGATALPALRALRNEAGQALRRE